jgi:hypothetical protein
VNAQRVYRDEVEQRTSSPCLVAVGRSGGDETFISPPDLDSTPIYGVTGGTLGKSRQHTCADATAGQAQAGYCAGHLAFDDRCGDPPSGCLCEGTCIGMAKNVDGPWHGQVLTLEMTSP